VIAVGARVVWNKGPEYGKHRGQGVVQHREVHNGGSYCHVRWDDPGLDDESVLEAQLSEVPDRQPLPRPNDLPQIADLVKADIDARRAKGVETYGVALQPMNGRSALQDLYEELLDGAHYVRQRIEEENEYYVEWGGSDAVERIAAIAELANHMARIHPPTSADHDLASGALYLLHLLRAQMHQLRLATQALVRAEHPPADLEAVGYQYRIAHPTEKPVYDESTDQDWLDRWCSDPNGECKLVEGYYPEFRLVYGGAWRPVDPEKPPEQPPGGWSVPPATDTPPSEESAAEGPPEPYDISAAESLPYLIWSRRVLVPMTQKQLAEASGVLISRVIQLQNYYVAVSEHEIHALSRALNLPEEEHEYWVDLALQSRCSLMSCPVCGHAPGQHTRVQGCIRCVCKTGRVVDGPNLTGSQI
jgi:hypothetical protein